MKSVNPFNDQSQSLTKRLPWTLFALPPIALLPIALLSLYFLPLSFTPSPTTELPHTTHVASSLPASPPFHSSTSAEKETLYENPCDYSNGKWVRDRRSSPLYNGTTCGKIKKSHNCITNGRPDFGYLYWRWKPSQCHLPRFESKTFLQLIKNKHIAFVGDSLSRNQIESLLCMLSTTSTPKRVHHKGSRRWHFPSHNAVLSFYWSPFLVQGVQRSGTGPHYNTMYLDHVNERWARDIDQMDVIVLSLGRWFMVPSVYYEGDSVLGCLNFAGLNCTEIDFYGPLRKALRNALNSIIERRAAKRKGIDVILRTFSPAHFKGDWDKGGTCSETRPYRKGEKQIEGVDAEIRRIEIEEFENAKTISKQYGGFRLGIIDVTKLALLRPDGHPGAYLNPFPFANGIPERVQNDCVHWCLPGPIDTWNEIFLEMMRKWEAKK